MNAKFSIGVIAGAALGMAGAFMLMQQIQPGSTSNLMKNGKRMFSRYTRTMGNPS
ncbi:MAG: hypothetical protein ACOYU3_03470 [Bacillota bacterium]